MEMETHEKETGIFTVTVYPPVKYGKSSAVRGLSFSEAMRAVEEASENGCRAEITERWLPTGNGLLRIYALLAGSLPTEYPVLRLKKGESVAIRILPPTEARDDLADWGPIPGARPGYAMRAVDLTDDDTPGALTRGEYNTLQAYRRQCAKQVEIHGSGDPKLDEMTFRILQKHRQISPQARFWMYMNRVRRQGEAMPGDIMVCKARDLCNAWDAAVHIYRNSEDFRALVETKDEAVRENEEVCLLLEKAFGAVLRRDGFDPRNMTLSEIAEAVVAKVGSTVKAVG